MTDKTLKKEDVVRALRLAYVGVLGALSGFKNAYAAIAGKDAAKDLYKSLNCLERHHKNSCHKDGGVVMTKEAIILLTDCSLSATEMADSSLAFLGIYKRGCSRINVTFMTCTRVSLKVLQLPFINI